MSPQVYLHLSLSGFVTSRSLTSHRVCNTQSERPIGACHAAPHCDTESTPNFTLLQVPTRPCASFARDTGSIVVHMDGSDTGAGTHRGAFVVCISPGEFLNIHELIKCRNGSFWLCYRGRRQTVRLVPHCGLFQHDCVHATQSATGGAIKLAQTGNAWCLPDAKTSHALL